MKLVNTMIAWNPPGMGEPRVKVGTHPDRTGWSNPYLMTDGACMVADWPTYSADERLLRLFVLFAIVTSRDGVSPVDAHNAFLEIDEYVEALPLDARRRA